MFGFSKLFGRSREQEELAEETIGAPSIQFGKPDVAERTRPKLPRFHGTAGDKVRPGANGRLEQIRFQLRTAFTPSRPVLKPAMFAGRTKLLLNLIRSIEDQQLHVVLFGARGIGKTSTLHILSGIAEEARYVVRYTSCGEDSNFDEMFRSVFEEIPLLYHANYEPTADEIEEGLNFTSLIGDTPLTVSHVSDIFSKISGTRVLIILDEFDRAGSPAFRRSIAELIKNLSDRASRVQLVIAGVASNLNELIEHIPSIRRNILGLPLPIMEDAEVTELIRNGETASGLVFADEAIDAVLDVAYGLPYLTSLVSQHAGIAALDRRHTLVRRDDIDTAIIQAFEEIEQRTSTVTRHHLDRAIADGLGAALNALAQAALGSGGRLLPEQVDSVSGDRLPSRTTFDRLQAQFQLIVPIVGDPADAYMFNDEGAPIYLWMRRASESLVNARTAPPLTEEL